MKQEDLMKFIKSQRLRWAANIMRMQNTRSTRKITEWTKYKTRPAGRPRLRQMDQVEEHLKSVKIIGWRAKLEDRKEWNRIIEQSKTHPVLQSQKKKKLPKIAGYCTKYSYLRIPLKLFPNHNFLPQASYRRDSRTLTCSGTWTGD